MNHQEENFHPINNMEQDEQFTPQHFQHQNQTMNATMSNETDISDSCFSGKVKLLDPQKFDGNPKNFKAFMSSIQLYFWAKSDVFIHDRDKIIFLGTHLLDSASIWFTSIVEDNDPCLEKYDSFIKQFRRNFSDPNIATNARGMIRKCSQGSRSVAAYAAEFRILGRNSGYDKLALVDQFLRGLNDKIMPYLMVAVIPDKLEGCIDSAMLIENRLNSRELLLRDRIPYKSHNPFRIGYSTTHHAPHTDQTGKLTQKIPMEIDYISPKPIGPLSTEEKTRRFENGLCKYCGGSGHGATSCPKKFKPGKDNSQQ
ncbi:Retrotransposon-derived protein PEG10 [Smittium culicis]|uniref:Retrotransposon-derived protein PEG10 n=1 Tax=Smittium culicis TaxID=133412 RepID=A0A1R1XDG0_9FUNG|nr:Retrotransposon-derived protein PEG10 [Smittium culicis]OMJ18898.1 Retrotransposon-derived protein PEG10 [Smittium culicis]